MAEQTNFSILNQRPIINLLIDGDVFPYMTGNEIQDLGIKFGVDSFDGSRWQMMQNILSSLQNEGNTTKFLEYFLSVMNINKAVKEVIQNNLAGNPPYKQISNILKESEDNNRYVAQTIRQELIKRINLELSVSGKKLVRNGKTFVVINSNDQAKIVADTSKIIDDDYIKELLDNSKVDLNNNDLDSIVTKSRTLIESVFIQILQDQEVNFKENGDIAKYRQEVNSVLRMKPDNTWNKSMVASRILCK
ncbi:hypothetical protein [Lentilactobacillus otakiensis]|uniref:hypothetical protein n=1 Tax=Lentilactobacillus otakiensis TaxID=481720 RepID=UPI003D173C50